jgi:hypothetical protein
MVLSCLVPCPPGSQQLGDDITEREPSPRVQFHHRPGAQQSGVLVTADLD